MAGRTPYQLFRHLSCDPHRSLPLIPHRINRYQTPSSNNLHHFRRCRPFITSSSHLRELQSQPSSFSSSSAVGGPIIPAPPIDLADPTSPSPSDPPPPTPSTAKNPRLVPASPSYFTTKPLLYDDLLHLQSLLYAHQTLPTLPPSQAPRVAWKKLVDYRLSLGEEVPERRYARILRILQRLNLIVPELMPYRVSKAIEKHKRAIDPSKNKRKEEVIDEWGRARGEGRRKSTKAQVWLVEGEGEVRVNGKVLSEVFQRVRDREAAIWPLVALGRLGRYNVWAKVKGGGTTGWAEGLAMAVGRALMVHEPGLKSGLRRAGVIRRDPRRVERKKPGHLKARKMPAWVKR